MTNWISIKVGTLTLTESIDWRESFSYAAHYQTIRVAPATYEVFASLTWTCDGGGKYRVHSLSARVVGTVTESYWPERRGTTVESWVDLPTYWCGTTANAPEGFAWDARALVVVEWDPAPWGDGYDHERDMGRMSRFEWSGAKLEITSRDKLTGQRMEAVLAEVF